MNTELKIDVPINTKELSVLAASALHEQLIQSEIFRSCINCASFREDTQICTLYNQKPPAKTIVFSCGVGWVADIPF